MDNKIPVIHTLESDMNEFSKNEESPVLAAQKQLENRIIPDITDNSGSKWKLLLRVVLIIIVLIVVGFTAYTLTTKKSATPVVNKPVTPKVKVFTASDVWPSMALTLASSTGEATSTNAFVIFTVNDFNKTYESVLQNEDKINELAGRYFNINELSPFTTSELNNVTLRVSDGGDRPMVYGYAGQKYLIFTTSVSDFFKIYEKLGGNASKSS